MSAGVYLAFPIDQAIGKLGVVDQVKRWLSTCPDCSWVFDPESAFSIGGSETRTPAIRAIDTEALRQADVVVACLPAGSVSIGVPMEMERAASLGKQVLIISDSPSWMLQYTEPNVTVVSSFHTLAKTTLSSMLRGVSRDLSSTPRVLVPTVVSKGAEEPRRGYEDDAGLDLVVSEDCTIPPRQFIDVPCGVRVQLPDWSWGMITGRSSTLRKRKLMVNQGIIDSGYRGPLFAGVWNMGAQVAKVQKGERIAQLLIIENATRRVRIQQVNALDPGSRGDKGFGSTGI